MSSLNWSSSDESIVTVDSGYVTGVSEGTADVTVSSPNGVKLTFSITVDGHYLTLSSTEALGLEVISNTKGPWEGSIEYKTIGSDWAIWNGEHISSGANNKLYLRGNNNTLISGNIEHSWLITGDSVSIDGNIETLLDYDTVKKSNHPIMSEYCFSNMFSGNSSIIKAPELPAIQLVSHCYDEMFSGCESLISAPELPATQLADYCYAGMFVGCSSLVNAPELPATQLADYCYAGMFVACSSLISAPELPATQLADYCYSQMFYYCVLLSDAPELPATQLAEGCYINMFSDCTSLISAPTLPATQLTDYCYAGMFWNCTSLTTAPALTATQIANNSYTHMFTGCTALVNDPTT